VAPELPWRPLADVITQPVLLERIGKVSSALTARSGDPAADVDRRVAASVTQLGLVARVVAPALAAQTLGQPLDLRLGGLWWQDTLGGPLPFSVPQPAGPDTASPAGVSPVAAGPITAGPVTASTATSGGVAADLDRLVSELLAEVVVPITAAVAALTPVSDRVLWGNVASAINGAASQLARVRPDLAPAAWATAAGFFRHPELGTEPGPPGPSFRRSSCCLIYRLEPGPAAAVCGDCVLGGRH
jgi:FhuF 2Fe-2S C-terminal domain